MQEQILALLRSSPKEYISGEEIANKLNVSRTAVWKHIQELKKRGYKIESHSRTGYILLESTELLLPLEIKNLLKTDIIGQNIIHYDTTSSTNEEAKDLAQKGAKEGTLVVTEEQVAGKGRLSRGWFSPKSKGIWFSIILRPNFLPQDAPKCTLLAAVAIVKAAEKIGIKLGIKWPNDILYKGKKLVGILTEMNAEMERINYVIIGIGINVNIKEKEIPSELKEIATSLAIIKGQDIPRLPFFVDILTDFENLYLDVQKNGFVGILNAWRKYSVTLGEMVNVIGIKETFTGKALDIDEDGALLVETSKGVERILAGDVSIRPATKISK